MSEYADLKARLRDGCNLQQRDGEQAADRIEALIAQRDAAVPADLEEAVKMAYECFEAVSGEGPRAFDWTDKPHRLVYDMYDTIRSLIALATAQADEAEKWKRAFAAQSSKLQAVLHIPGVKDALAAMEGKP